MPIFDNTFRSKGKLKKQWCIWLGGKRRDRGFGICVCAAVGCSDCIFLMSGTDCHTFLQYSTHSHVCLSPCGVCLVSRWPHIHNPPTLASPVPRQQLCVTGSGSVFLFIFILVSFALENTTSKESL